MLKLVDKNSKKLISFCELFKAIINRFYVNNINQLAVSLLKGMKSSVNIFKLFSESNLSVLNSF
jgi:hypothetical protein